MSHFFWNNLFKQTESESEIVTQFWQNTPLFKDIPARHIKALAENMHIRNYQPDEIVFRAGDQSAGAILLLEGKIKIMANTTQLAKINEGDFLAKLRWQRRTSEPPMLSAWKEAAWSIF